MKFHIQKMLGRRQMQTGQKLTIAWLSRTTGVSPNTIYKLETGRADRIATLHIDALCAVLNCTLSQLAEESAINMNELPIVLRTSRPKNLNRYLAPADDVLPLPVNETTP